MLDSKNKIVRFPDYEDKLIRLFPDDQKPYDWFYSVVQEYGFEIFDVKFKDRYSQVDHPEKGNAYQALIDFVAHQEHAKKTQKKNNEAERKLGVGGIFSLDQGARIAATSEQEYKKQLEEFLTSDPLIQQVEDFLNDDIYDDNDD